MRKLPSSLTYARCLALVRIVTGCLWLAHGVPKFTKSAEFMPPNGAINAFIAHAISTAPAPYAGFLTNTVQPNIALFAELVRLGEVCVGLSLVFGVLSRAGGLFGVVLTLNYIAARGNIVSSETLQSVDVALLVLSAISLMLPTGRVLGVDALFSRPKAPPPPVVRAEFVPEPPLEGPTAPPD